MEKDFSRGHLEELLKERTDEYKMYPTERVWNGIYHRLHTRRKWHFIGGGTFALMIMAGVFLLMQDNTRPISRISTASAPSVKSLRGAGDQYSVFSGKLSLRGQAAIPSGKFHSLMQAGSQAGNDFINAPYGLAARLDPSLSPLGQFTGAGIPDTARETTVPAYTAAVDISAPAGNIPVPAGAGDNVRTLHFGMIKNDPLLTPGKLGENVPALSTAQKSLMPSRSLSRFSWLFHFEPSVSFRTLKSKAAIKTNYGFIVVDNNGYDINGLVNQRPSVGFEVGTDFLYSLTSRLRLKAGLQFNYSRYTAQAYNTVIPQPVIIALGGPGTGGIPAATAEGSTPYVNAGSARSAGATWIPDQRAELSLPVGAEFQILHNQNVSWNVAGSFQPSYILNAKAFLLSQDYKNYVQDPNLLRRWNMNVAAETFVRINKGKVQLQIGPQIRYQLEPSFINSYPIKEHLYDIGFKIGVTRSIR
jgi:hypothetical protein